MDSTFYGTPSAATVEKWREKTPPDFVFAAKVPQVITHEKVLVDCDEEWKNFLTAMDILGDKLGPLLFQFGHFNSSPQRQLRRYAAIVPLALLLFTGATLAACSGGMHGTPTGPVPLKITATSGTLSQTANVTLTVQ